MCNHDFGHLLPSCYEQHCRILVIFKQVCQHGCNFQFKQCVMQFSVKSYLLQSTVYFIEGENEVFVGIDSGIRIGSEIDSRFGSETGCGIGSEICSGIGFGIEIESGIGIVYEIGNVFETQSVSVSP